MAPSDHDDAKELTRKLYWAITSTYPQLTRQQKSGTFTWAADMAERIINRLNPSLPPTVDSSRKNGYHGLAVGRGGGRLDPSHTEGDRLLPPPNMAAWERDQAEKRRKAWSYVLEGRRNGDQIPIPEHVYREVGNGRSNSTG